MGPSPRNPFPLTVLALAFAAQACARPPADRPNIVLLVADDMDFDHFGFVGHPLAQTPSIDRLAEGGVVFSHGFVPMSRCRPAQASLLSGRWPHQNGVYFNVGADHIDPVTSLANQLSDAGYATIGEGKFWEYDPRGMGFSNYTIRNYETFVREGQTHLFRFLEEHSDEPFFVWWAPELPHTPHNPPPRHREKFDPDTVPVPDYVEGDPAAFRRAEQLSLAMEAWLDEGIAELVEKLRELGTYENTLFCFLIDNGYANGLPSKGTAHEKGLRTPVIFYWEKGLEGGRTFDELTTTVDVYATLLDLAGAPIPKTCAGRSLRPLIMGIGDESFEPREALYGALYLQTPDEPNADAARDAYALWARTRRWKYVFFLQEVRATDDRRFKIQANFCAYPERERGDEDLYDLQADPDELANLAELPEHRARMDALREEALAWWRETGGKPLELP